MKTNGTRLLLIVLFLQLLLLVFAFCTKAQPDYYHNFPSFKKATNNIIGDNAGKLTRGTTIVSLNDNNTLIK